MAHSIPESNAIVLRTKYPWARRCPGRHDSAHLPRPPPPVCARAGTVFHTGDWKFDDSPMIGAATDKLALQALGDEGVLAVIGDSTNARHEGRSRSEGRLRDNLIDMFQKIETKGTVIVTCFSSNIARLETIAIAAEASGRMVHPKIFYLTHKHTHYFV